MCPLRMRLHYKRHNTAQQEVEVSLAAFHACPWFLAAFHVHDYMIIDTTTLIAM